MKDWFANLQPRERLIVIGGGVAFLIIVVWASLTTLRTGTAELRESVTDKQRLLIDLARVEALGGAAPSGTGQVATQSLLSLVDSTTQANGIAASRTRTDGPDGVNLSFEATSFDALLRWLIALETTHGVTVESASFTGGRERGLVNGQLSLRRR